MMMPSTVSADRILLRAIAFMPTLRIVRNLSIVLRPPAAAPRCGGRATGRSSTSLPSRNTTTRLAYSAMSGSCVISTTVLPSSFSLWKTRHDLLGGLRVEVAGRLVGEHELGLVDQRAGDRDALLLAARELARLVVLAAGQPDDRAGTRAPSRCAPSPELPRRRSRSAAAPRSRAPRCAASRLKDWKTNPIFPLRISARCVAVERRHVDAVEEVACPTSAGRGSRRCS